MAGMCGLQTSHRYGNATMLASDFVLGIGNRWAIATPARGGLCKGRKFIHFDIEPTQIGRVFAPDYGIVSDAKAALQLLSNWHANGKRPASYATVEVGGECQGRKASLDYLRQNQFDNVPMNATVYQCMCARSATTSATSSTIGPVADRRRAVPACYKPRHWINCGQAGRSAGRAGGTRRARSRSPAQDRRAVG